jgi:exopolysaccharide biosynthesis polyprenyl glycosylphosphotransferase
VTTSATRGTGFGGTRTSDEAIIEVESSPPKTVDAALAERRNGHARRAQDTYWSDSKIADAEGTPVVQRRERIYRRCLACSDVLCAALAMVISIEILGDGQDHIRLETLLALPIVVLASKLVGLYDRDELLLRKTTLEEAPAIFQLATVYTMTVWLLQPLFVAGSLGQKQVFGLWMMLFVCSLLGRASARAIARRVVDEERCVVIGEVAIAEQLKAKLKADPKVSARVVGVLGFGGMSSANGAGLESSSKSLLRDTLHDLKAERALVSPSSLDSVGAVDLIRVIKSLGVRVSVFPGTAEIVGSSVEPDEIHGLTVLGVRRFGLTKSSQLVKRGFDLLGSAALLIVTAPILGLFAATIKLDSRGPVFFSQTRVGRRGNRFKMVKFRTMDDGADAKKSELQELNEADGLFKIAEDPRITRVGRFLRSTSLDELPQLWNVLRGEMSLVGPRPLVIDDDQRVEGWYRHRLELTPGMTGHWQILGSSRIPLHEMVEIDYLYVANWSIWTDIKILIRTLPHVIARNGQ